MATVSDRGWASDICIHASPYGQTAPTIFKGHTVGTVRKQGSMATQMPVNNVKTLG